MNIIYSAMKFFFRDSFWNRDDQFKPTRISAKLWATVTPISPIFFTEYSCRKALLVFRAFAPLFEFPGTRWMNGACQLPFEMSKYIASWFAWVARGHVPLLKGSSIGREGPRFEEAASQQGSVAA